MNVSYAVYTEINDIPLNIFLLDHIVAYFYLWCIEEGGLVKQRYISA